MLSQSDKKTVSVAGKIESLDLTREQLEMTLSMFILMKFHQDERQAISFLEGLKKKFN